MSYSYAELIKDKRYKYQRWINDWLCFYVHDGNPVDRCICESCEAYDSYERCGWHCLVHSIYNSNGVAFSLNRCQICKGLNIYRLVNPMFDIKAFVEEL